MEAEFFWPVRVYYEDTDNGGVVYYANYLKFMERARTEWLRTRGVEQDVLVQQQGVIFAVRSAQLDYLKPARFNQLLAVSVNVVQVGKASLTFEQRVIETCRAAQNTINATRSTAVTSEAEQRIPHKEGEGQEHVVLCRGRIKIACLDANSFKPRAIPTSIRQEIFGDH
jgi:acyl-CoA thioester hydrolase